VCVCAEDSLGVLGASPHSIAGVITTVLQLIGDREVVVCLKRFFQSHLLCSNSCVLARGCVFLGGGGGGGAVGPDFFKINYV
jgi:hypothetical protein